MQNTIVLSYTTKSGNNTFTYNADTKELWRHNHVLKLSHRLDPNTDFSKNYVLQRILF